MMKFLKAKRLAEQKAMSGPAENKEQPAEWLLETSPEAYLERWPKGPRAELARAIIARESAR